MSGSIDTVRVLLDAGAAKCLMMHNISGYLPIHTAQRYGHEAVVRMLLDYRREHYWDKCTGGEIILHIAAAFASDISAFQDLFFDYTEEERNIRNNDGWTLLHFAASYVVINATVLIKQRK